MAGDFKVGVDASLGLVYRLNNHWALADSHAMDGSYDEWNNVLDVIFRNLLYKEPLEVIESKTGIEVKVSEKDMKVWNVLNKNVIMSKRNWIKSKRLYPKKLRVYWSRRYQALQNKDLFLRKLMFKLKLYLKVTERNTGTSTFGSFG